MIFFSQKTTNKIFMYLLSPFIVQNFKKVLRADPELWDVPFLGPKWPICPENFFWYKPLLLLSSTYWPFSLCKILKKFLEPIQSCEMCHFWDQNGPFVLKIFFGTNHYCYFHLPIGLFHCAKLKKKSYSWSRDMRMHHFGAQNGPFALINFFFFGKLLIPFSSTY